MKTRDDFLIKLLEDNNQTVLEYYVNYNNTKSDLKTAKSIDFKNIDVIFTASNLIVLVIMRYCFLNSIKILSIGNSLIYFDEFLTPSLSIIQIPMENMTEECITVISSLFHGHCNIQKTIEPIVLLRETFH